MRIIDYYINNKNKSLLILHCLVLCLTSYFFLHYDYFLLSDYPNYLARINLYNHLSDTQQVLSEYYYKNFQITPYMGFPVIALFLEPLVGIYHAGKIFIVFAISVIISGGLFLNYTLYNRITAFSLLLHIFIFNYTLSMGFMNFTLVLGLVLWGFAFWLRYYNHTLKFYILFAIYSIAVFFCHVFGLFLLGLLIGLHHLSLYPIMSVKGFFNESIKATLKVLSFTIIPMIIALSISTSKNGIGFPLQTGYIDIYTNVLSTYLTPLLFTFNYMPNILITFFVIVIILKKIELKQPFIVACLVVLALFVPFRVLGVACINLRIPALIGLLFATSATFKGENRHVVFCSVLTGIFSIFVYITNIQMLYQQDLQVREFIKTIKSDPNLNGKRLLTVNNTANVHNLNLPSYATIEANMLVPELMTYIPPISMYKKYAEIYGCQSEPISSKKLRMSDSDAKKFILSKISKPHTICPHDFYWQHWRQDFDYVFWIHFKSKPKNVPSELIPYKQGSFFTIYKIKR